MPDAGHFHGLPWFAPPHQRLTLPERGKDFRDWHHVLELFGFRIRPSSRRPHPNVELIDEDGGKEGISWPSRGSAQGETEVYRQ